MSSPSIYPPQLADSLALSWQALKANTACLPDRPCLVEFLEILFQASFLQEEGDPVRCRAILADPQDWPQGMGPPAGFHVLLFDEARPFTPQEVRKLDPAASYDRALLGIHHSQDGSLHIWGIIDTGTRWVNRIDGGRFHGTPLPSQLVGHILGPGHLLMACGYQRMIELAGGQITESGFDPFRSQWLPDLFKPVRTKLLEKLAASDLQGAEVDDIFVKMLGQNVLRRTMSLVRGRGHGGMLIYLPARMIGSEELPRWVRIRCPFRTSAATGHFTELMMRAMRRLAKAGQRRGLEKVTWTSYQELDDPTLAEVDESFFELGHLFADLMGADGALTLTFRFEMLGFGAEVLGEKAVHEVYRALDLEGLKTQPERADSAGTRHRAAYRLVAGVPDALVVVMSQDGSIRFVANREGRVTYWPYLP